jgi:hypothetical protein
LYLDLIKLNINISPLNSILLIFNIPLLFQALSQSLKYPNASLIFPFVIVYIYYFILLICKKISKNNFNYELYRPKIILISFLIFYIFSLVFIGYWGYERRQINLIPYLFIIFILSLKFFKINNEIFQKTYFFILILFIFYFRVQLKNFSEILDFKSQEFNLKFFLILGVIFFYFVISIYFIFKNKNILLTLILINIFFHLNFNRSSSTLKNIKIVDNLTSKNIITGISAHHLSIENKIFPIWWLNQNIYPKYPKWNQNFPFFNKSHNTIIITDKYKNQQNGYFPVSYANDRSEKKKKEVFFLFPKYNQSNYADTVYAYYY